MYIFVGLGNPGQKYANTRHNLGFITIDQLAEKWNIPVNRSRFQALVGEGFYDGEKVVLVKPQTYMNLSGRSVRQVLDWYKPDLDHLVVIYDDLDLELGTLRIRPKGSPGSHNGMKSVTAAVGQQDFPRIRIGIGSNGERDIIHYVTGGFTKEEVGPLEEAVTRAVSACACIVSESIELAMTRYNGK